MTKSVSERELVLGILMEVTEKGKYSHIVLREVLEKYQYLDKKERAFITRVSEGTLEHMIEMDYILDKFSSVKTKKMKPVIRNILRSAVYQLKYMDHVPDSAVCNEAVKLAVKKGFGNLRGFVNGVLRSVARGLKEVSLPEDAMEAMSVKYSMPMWILEHWANSYSMDTMETMLSDFQKEKPLTIRWSAKEKKAEEVLKAEGVTVKRHPYLSYAYQISGYDYLGELNSFSEGDFSVQDISSMLVCELSGVKEGDFVIDVCAAPGGKALHMAEMLHGTGMVEARDLTAYKVGLIEENIWRTGENNIRAICRDATVLDKNSVEKADIVIADLPCSGLGVLGKKTDLKYKATPQGTCDLSKLQREILHTVSSYVKPGGVLMYSTCTINQAENQENVQWFLEKHPEYRLADIRDSLCDALKKDVEESGMLQLLPGIHESDGFFLAKMKKIS